MDIASRIRRMGFRKWYERQLIESHLAFTTCFLCGIVVASCLEAITFAEFGWKPASLLAVVFGAIGLGWYSWRRYITVLERAEVYGNRSTCPACKTYARFEVLATGHAAEGPYLDPAATPLPYPWLRVKCRQCGTAWRMPE
jgi:formate dehydrogenase maturation protein FdhE